MTDGRIRREPLNVGTGRPQPKESPVEPDKTIIEAARARHAALADRLPEAQRVAASASAAAEAARAALAAVVKRAAAGEVVDPTEAQKAVADAEGRASFAASVADHLATEIADAEAGHIRARAEAHQRVFRAGLALRLDACERAESAAEALAGAHADFERANGLIGVARANGWRADVTSQHYPALLPADPHAHKLPAPATERAFQREIGA